MKKIVNCHNDYSQAKPAKYSFNLRIFNICLFSIIFFLGFIYLIGVSDLTVKGFALQESKTRLAVLANEKLAYEQKADSLQSYYVLSERAKLLNMVAINDIEYIKVDGHIIAKK